MSGLLGRLFGGSKVKDSKESVSPPYTSTQKGVSVRDIQLQESTDLGVEVPHNFNFNPEAKTLEPQVVTGARSEPPKANKEIGVDTIMFTMAISFDPDTIKEALLFYLKAKLPEPIHPLLKDATVEWVDVDGDEVDDSYIQVKIGKND